MHARTQGTHVTMLSAQAGFCHLGTALPRPLALSGPAQPSTTLPLPIPWNPPSLPSWSWTLLHVHEHKGKQGIVCRQFLFFTKTPPESWGERGPGYLLWNKGSGEYREGKHISKSAHLLTLLSRPPPPPSVPPPSSLHLLSVPPPPPATLRLTASSCTPARPPPHPLASAPSSGPCLCRQGHADDGLLPEGSGMSANQKGTSVQV